jgi:hypothetical protein
MWKLKDPEAVKAMIIRLLSDDEIAKRCNRQMDDRSSYILLSDDNDEILLRLDKERFVNVPEYKPDDWNPYPEVKPPRRGYYLVTRLRTRDNGDTYKGVDLCLFGLNNSDIFANSNILAFRELPEPYDPMPWEDDDSEPEEGD